jgi:peptidoglycan/LPS O-acetylase OafA/YrhL
MRSSRGGRVRGLDGLRAIAVLAVMCFHSGFTVAGRGGFWGVDVFFVLSGFLITGVLLGEREATGRVSLGRFFARRALRLYPPLIVMVIVLTPVGGSIALGWNAWWSACILSLTYTTDLVQFWHWLELDHGPFNPLGQTWSLAIEEQFYLLWAPLFVLAGFGARGRRAGLGAVAAVLGLIAALLGVALLTRSADPTAGSIYSRPDMRFTQLLLGAALAFLLDARPPGAAMRRALGPLSLLAIGGILATILAFPVPFHRTWHALLLWMVVLSVSTTVLIARLVTDERAVLSRILAWPPLVAIGVRSYALYLWHFPLYTLIQPELLGHHLSRPAEAVLQWGATFVAAELSLRLVERPAWRLKDRLRTTPVAGIEAEAPAPTVASSG